MVQTRAELLLEVRARNRARQAWNNLRDDGRKSLRALDVHVKRVRGSFFNLRNAVLAAGAAFAFDRQIQQVDDLAKSSRRLNLGVKALSELKFAADENGVAYERLRAGLRFLQTRVVEAAEGNARYADTFRQLGVAVQDSQGRLKGTEKLLEEIADGYSRLPEGARRAALAQRVFGEESSAVVSILERGREGLIAARKEAEFFGASISAIDAKRVEEYNDAMLRLRASTGSIFRETVTTFAEQVTPALNGISVFIAKNREGLADLFRSGARMAGVFAKVALSGLGRVASLLARFSKDGFSTLFGNDEFGRRAKDAAAAVKEVRKEIDQLELRRDRLARRTQGFADFNSYGFKTQAEAARELIEVEEELDRKRRLHAARLKYQAQQGDYFGLNRFEKEFSTLLSTLETGAQVKVRVQDSDARAKLEDLRRNFVGIDATVSVRVEEDLKRLRDQLADIGKTRTEARVAVDDAQANERLEHVRAQLAALSALSPILRVDAENREAIEKMREASERLTELDGGKALVELQVDTRDAVRRIKEVSDLVDTRALEDLAGKIRAVRAEAQLPLRIELPDLGAYESEAAAVLERFGGIARPVVEAVRASIERLRGTITEANASKLNPVDRENVLSALEDVRAKIRELETVRFEFGAGLTEELARASSKAAELEALAKGFARISQAYLDAPDLSRDLEAQISRVRELQAEFARENFEGPDLSDFELQADRLIQRLGIARLPELDTIREQFARIAEAQAQIEGGTARPIDFRAYEEAVKQAEVTLKRFLDIDLDKEVAALADLQRRRQVVVATGVEREVLLVEQALEREIAKIREKTPRLVEARAEVDRIIEGLTAEAERKIAELRRQGRESELAEVRKFQQAIASAQADQQGARDTLAARLVKQVRDLEEQRPKTTAAYEAQQQAILATWQRYYRDLEAIDDRETSAALARQEAFVRELAAIRGSSDDATRLRDAAAERIRTIEREVESRQRTEEQGAELIKAVRARLARDLAEIERSAREEQLGIVSAWARRVAELRQGEDRRAALVRTAQAEIDSVRRQVEQDVSLREQGARLILAIRQKLSEDLRRVEEDEASASSATMQRLQDELERVSARGAEARLVGIRQAAESRIRFWQDAIDKNVELEAKGQELILAIRADAAEKMKKIREDLATLESNADIQRQSRLAAAFENATANRASEYFENIAFSIQSANRSWKEFANNLLRDLARIALRSGVSGGIGGLFSLAGGGTFAAGFNRGAGGNFLSVGGKKEASSDASTQGAQLRRSRNDGEGSRGDSELLNLNKDSGGGDTFNIRFEQSFIDTRGGEAFIAQQKKAIRQVFMEAYASSPKFRRAGRR